MSLTVSDCDGLAIVGPSGLGKSTVLYLMGCLDKPTGGEVWVDGVSTSGLPDRQLSLIRRRVAGALGSRACSAPLLVRMSPWKTPTTGGSSDGAYSVDERRPGPGAPPPLWANMPTEEGTIVNTHEILQVALELAGMTQVPADSAVYVPGEGLSRALVGIDLDEAELLLAKQLGYDVAVAHHPAGGTAVVHYHRVLERHVEQMLGAGVSRQRAQDAVADLIAERKALNGMRNYDRAPAVARMLGIAYLNIHTPLDEIGRARMADCVGELSPSATVEDLICHLEGRFGEFRNALTDIEPVVGDRRNAIGRAVVAHGAGTNGGHAVAKAYFEQGVQTVIYIHCRPQDARRLAQEYAGKKVNLVVTGHIASDSVGINPFVDELRRRGMDVTASLGVVPA